MVVTPERLTPAPTPSASIPVLTSGIGGAEPPLHDRRRLFRALLIVISVHWLFTAAVGDFDVSGSMFAILLLVALTGGIDRVHAALAAAGRAALSVVIATLGLAFGVGVGVNHLTRRGLDGVHLLAVPAVAAALGLLIVAARHAARGGWRRTVATAVGSVLFVYYVLFPATLGVWATHRVAEEPSGLTPAAVDLPFDDVTLSTPDGERLVAWYVPSRNGAAVIVRHGASSSRESMLEHVDVLARAGFGVLAMDARGHGSSSGESNAFGWFAHDISVGVDFLVREANIESGRIGVLGLSMGGEEALTAAASDGRIGAVVAEGATTRTTGDFLEIDKGLAMWLSAPHYWVMYTTADLLSDARPPDRLVDAVAAIAPRPVLVIAAGDVATERTFGARFVDAAPATTQLWVVPNSGHTDGIRTAPEEWRARVLEHFDAALGVSD